MFVRFQFKSTIFAELVRDKIARSDVGCIPPTGSGFVVERIEFPQAGPLPMDVDQSGSIVLDPTRNGGRLNTLFLTDGDGNDIPLVGQVMDDGFEYADVDGNGDANGRGDELVLAARRAATEHETSPGPRPGSPRPGPVAERPPALSGRIRFPFPGQIFETGFETITVPVVDGSPLAVRRRKLLLTLPVTLTIRSLTDILAGTGTPLVITIDIRLQMDLVHRPDGRDYVRAAFAGVGHREGNDPTVEGLIRQELAGTDVSREVEFEYTAAVLKAVTSMGGGGEPPTVAWSGMSLSTDRQAVELRLEVNFDGATGTRFPDEWQRFLTRQFDDFRTGNDWAVEITRDLLDVAATAGAREQVANQSGFDLAGTGPHVEWRPDFPGFRTTFTGEIIDACSCFGFDIDLNVSVEVTSKLRLVQGGTSPRIEIDTLAKGDATHAGEQACCAITGTLFFPILGWKYLAEGKIGWGGLALGMFVPIVGSFITMWQLFDPTPRVPVPDNCRKDGDHQICTYEIQLDPEIEPCNPPASSISLDLLRGRNNGLVLAGSVQQTYRSAPEVAASRATPFVWRGPRPTCTGTQGDWRAQSNFTVTQIDGGFPLEVCDAIAVGPVAPIFQPHVFRTRDCPASADVSVITAVPWTIGGPDPIPILVLTNVGAKLVKLPPLPALTDEEIRAHDRFVAIWQRTHCGIFDPGLVANNGYVLSTWLVEPPPDDEPARRLWVIRAGGLDEGELLVASRPQDGEVLATAASDARRGLRIDLLHDGDDVMLTRRRADGSAGGPMEGASISLAQLLLEEIDAYDIGEPAGQLRASGPPSKTTLEVELDGRSEVLRLGPSGRIGPAKRPGWSAPEAAPQPPSAPAELATGRERYRAPSDQVREVAAAACRARDDGDESARRLAPTSNSWRWIADDGPDGWVEIDERAAKVTTRYRDRPWFDGMVYAGGVWARLDNDGTTVRTYRVRDAVTL